MKVDKNKRERKLLHQELISPEHYCVICGRNKEKVQFRVCHYKDARRKSYPDKLCIDCLHGINVPNKIDQQARKRKEIKDGFDRYFKEKE